MFSLDLDEIDAVTKKIFLLSRNRFNVFNFRDRDHLQLTGDSAQDVKAQLLFYLHQQGVPTNEIKRIQLVTNLCTLGYQFNPVSFYFCFDRNEQALCSMVEVNNTFGEMKLYYLGKDTEDKDHFNAQIVKHFYVSPFIDMDTNFHFRLKVPDEKLNITINDYQQGQRFFLSTLQGERKALTNINVLKYAIRFPFITLQIITLIHWQALRLWMKKIAYHKKSSFTALQKNVLKPHKSLLN